MTKRTPALEAALLDAFADGLPLGKICRKLGIARTTVHSWRRADADFAERYLDAQAAHADALIEQVLEIADDPRSFSGGPDAQRQLRLRLDMRLRVARIHMRQ